MDRHRVIPGISLRSIQARGRGATSSEPGPPSGERPRHKETQAHLYGEAE